jgi:hypothetical protein
VFPYWRKTVEEYDLRGAWFDIVLCLLIVIWFGDVAGLLATDAAKGVVLCLSSSGECGGSLVGEG